MYNDKIKVANKIITYDDLYEIFSKMNEKLSYYKKISAQEETNNKMLEYNYQKWSFRDSNSSLSFTVDFHDDTSIKFDNYNNFITIFNSRLDDIKSIYVYFNLSYSKTSQTGKNEYYHQYIHMWIYEYKLDMDIALSSEDNKADDIYELMKNKVLNAKERYDEVVKKKDSIKTTVGIAIGFIPALIISTLLLLVPSIRYAFATSYVLYPICCMILTFSIGIMFGASLLDDLYKNIAPEKKYAGYDSNRGVSIYKDDITSYLERSEILIGKNIDNLKCRKEILERYEKFKKYIPYEIGIMLIISLVVLLLGEI